MEALRIIEESPDKWAAKEYPIQYDTVFEGREVPIEVSMLRHENGFRLRVSAYDNKREAGQSTSNCAIIPLNKALRFLGRADAIRQARSIASHIETGTYEEWAAKEYPVIYQKNFEGHQMRIDINALGYKTDQLVLHVSVDDCGILGYAPARAAAFIPRPKTGAAK